jgi:hypothetical protein
MHVGMHEPICTAKLTKISHPEIKILVDHGFHPHQVKGPNTRKTFKSQAGKVFPWDLYKDRDRNVFIWNGYNAAEPEDTGINIDELRALPLSERKRK